MKVKTIVRSIVTLGLGAYFVFRVAMWSNVKNHSARYFQLDIFNVDFAVSLKKYFSKLIDEVLKLINSSLLKLLDGLTSETYSHEYEFEDLQPFPSVTFCPFFRVSEEYESFAEADRNTPLMPNYILDFDHKFNDKYIIIFICLCR